MPYKLRIGEPGESGEFYAAVMDGTTEFCRCREVPGRPSEEADGRAHLIVDAVDALQSIVKLTEAWDANRLGPAELQRHRWQRLGQIARAALEDN